MSLSAWLLATRADACVPSANRTRIWPAVLDDVQGGEDGALGVDDDTRAEGHLGGRRGSPGAGTGALGRHRDERRADRAVGGRGVRRRGALLLLRLLEAGLHRAVDVGPGERRGPPVGGPPQRQGEQRADDDDDDCPRPPRASPTWSRPVGRLRLRRRADCRRGRDRGHLQETTADSGRLPVRASNSRRTPRFVTSRSFASPDHQRREARHPLQLTARRHAAPAAEYALAAGTSSTPSQRRTAAPTSTSKGGGYGWDLAPGPPIVQQPAGVKRGPAPRRAGPRRRTSLVDADGGVPRNVHAAAGHHHRERRAAEHPAGPGQQFLGPAVGRRRLRADARRGSADQRVTGRPVRATAALLGGAWHLHTGLAAVRHGHRVSVPRAGPRTAGHRRCDDVRRLTRPARPDVPRQGPRHRVRRVGRDHRSRGRGRSGGRWRPDVGLVLALDLLRQPPARADRRGDHRHPRSRVARSAAEASGLAGLCQLHGVDVGPGLGADQVRRAGIQRRAGARVLRGGGGAAARVPRSGDHRAPSDVRPDPVPQADFHRRVGGRVRRVRVDLLDVSLPHHLSAGRPGLLRSANRRALADRIRCDLRCRSGGGAGLVACSRAPVDRSRLDRGRGRSGVDARARRGIEVDASGTPGSPLPGLASG